MLSKNLYIEQHQFYEGRPTLVFLHDSLGSVELWRDFPQKLADATKCNILMYDRLGYGKSEPMQKHERTVNYLELEADILNDLLQELELKNAILFGHSDGGSIALITAAKYPENIKATIVEAAHIFVEDVTIKGIEEAVTAYENTNLPERLKKYHGNKVGTLFRAWTETWLRNDYKEWNIEHLLSGINAPLLFIQGENDEYGTLKQVEKTIENVSGSAEKYIIPNIGHTPHKEAPEIVLKKVTDFVNHL